MSQIQAKVCMLGYFGVGKTSLVGRFVKNVYSEKYLTTVGVKVDTKTIEVDHTTVKLVVWDIAGEAELSPATRTYLRGAAGYLVVADGTRKHTLDTAIGVLGQVQATPSNAVLLLNKADLTDMWEIEESDLEQVPVQYSRTSAKSGDNVEAAFQSLARAILADRTD